MRQLNIIAWRVPGLRPALTRPVASWGGFDLRVLTRFRNPPRTRLNPETRWVTPLREFYSGVPIISYLELRIS